MSNQAKFQFISSAEDNNITVGYNSDEHALDAGYTLEVHDVSSDKKVLVNLSALQMEEIIQMIQNVSSIKSGYKKNGYER